MSGIVESCQKACGLHDVLLLKACCCNWKIYVMYHHAALLESETEVLIFSGGISCTITGYYRPIFLTVAQVFLLKDLL